MKNLLIILLLTSCLPLFSQSIFGYVYDEAEDKPLEGAFVYLDGTTLSASTDAQGFFKINAGQKYNSVLVISYMGYENLRIQDPFSYDKPIKAMLREDAINLTEVVIDKKKGPFSRKQMLRVFREEFLGQSKAGRSCKIENEEDIRLYYSLSDNTLHAETKKPIRIVNERLGYRILFDLAGFSVKYKVQSLESIYIASSFFAGTTAFTDIAKKKDKAENLRKEAYLGSTVHLMKTLVSEDWQKQKFGFYVGSFPDNPTDYFSVKDTLDFKKVTIIKIPEKEAPRENVFPGMPVNPGSKYGEVSFNLLYDKKEQSSLTFKDGFFYVDPNGLFFPLSEITFGGHMAGLKAGDLLPADYIYRE